MVKIDLSGAPAPGGEMLREAELAYARVVSGEGELGKWNGWLHPELFISQVELDGIITAAEKIKSEAHSVVVLGIGGSYLGAKAAIDFLRSPFYNPSPKSTPDIYFAGNNLSGEYLRRIISLVAGGDLSVIVISKSGKTMETSLAFRVFLNLLQAKYGERAADRIYAVTSPNSGALREYAEKSGCRSFVIPENIGGRYSVLTAVGLLPMAVAGIDIRTVLNGAEAELSGAPDAALSYAAVRQSLYRSGKKLEIMGCYEPSFRYMGEWWRQLFAESEGKSGRGLFPVYEQLSTDLHSIGQYVQEGERTMFETLVSFDENRSPLLIPPCDVSDGFDSLAGLDFSTVSRASSRGVKEAHMSGGVPVIELSVPDSSEAAFGGLVCFFELACAVSSVISGVNPFNQPGVEAYKSNFMPNLRRLLSDESADL